MKKAGIAQLGKNADLDKVLKVLKDEEIIPEKSNWEDVPFYKPLNDDTKDGYSGRIGIQEVLVVTEDIKNLIISNSTAEQIHEQAQKEGMLTMMEDGIYKAAAGITTIEEVMRVVSE